MLSSCGIVIVVVVALVVLQTSLAQEAKIDPLLPVVVGRPIFPKIKCTQGCQLETGSDGCLKCTCPASCENVICPTGYVCQMKCALRCCPQPSCVQVLLHVRDVSD